jgi:hypothetical protein
MVWNILRRFLPENITGQVRGMRAFKDQSGACFDVPDNKACNVEDIFEHAQQQRSSDFTIVRAQDLPELVEEHAYGNRGGSDNYRGGGGGGYGQ